MYMFIWERASKRKDMVCSKAEGKTVKMIYEMKPSLRHMFSFNCSVIHCQVHVKIRMFPFHTTQFNAIHLINFFFGSIFW